MKKATILTLVIIFVLFPLFNATVFAKSKAKKSSQVVSRKVNINTAGITELKTLPRVGEKIAKRIIDYRKKHGKFKRIEDIMKVKGIGEKTFLKMKNRLTVK